MTDVAVVPSAARSRTIVYWIATALITAEFAVGGVWDLLRIPYVQTILTHLGYPLYFATFMAIWKLPGSVVLLLLRLPRLKEWVYAGMIYEMTGAGRPDRLDRHLMAAASGRTMTAAGAMGHSAKREWNDLDRTLPARR
jgi:hypothetical protein